MTLNAALALLSRALAARPSAFPVRIDLGAELMTSTSQSPERWVELLAFAKKERRRLKLDGRVLFAHDFEHHFEIAGDVVARMDAAKRRALGRYVAGLDAEIARGHEGLARDLAREGGRRALSASLWTVGRHYDVFGWDDPKDAIPAAADADRAYLSGR